MYLILPRNGDRWLQGFGGFWSDLIRRLTLDGLGANRRIQMTIDPSSHNIDRGRS